MIPIKTGCDIDELRITLTQEADACGSAEDTNTLEIIVLDGGGGPYLVLETARWALDGPEDLVDTLRVMLGLLGGKEEEEKAEVEGENTA